MDIKFTQRYNQGEIGARVPLFQTEYSRVYGLAGGRFAWFFERFQWRTVSYDINGQAARGTPPTTPTPCPSGCTARSSGAGTRCTSASGSRSAWT